MPKPKDGDIIAAVTTDQSKVLTVKLFKVIEDEFPNGTVDEMAIALHAIKSIDHAITVTIESRGHEIVMGDIN